MAHVQKFLPQGYSFITDEETGKRYAIPAGGDGTGDVEKALAANQPEDDEDDDDDDLEEDDDDELEEDEDEDNDEDNFNGETFLNSIEDEALRGQLEPHVKRWDAGVTRRFQELHSRVKPYEQLGTHEQLSEAAQIYEILNSDPQKLYTALAQSLGYNTGQQGQPGPGTGQVPGQKQNQNPGQVDGLTKQEYAQLSPQDKQKFDQYGEIINTLAEAYLGQEKQRQQQAEDEQLDDYLDNLKSEFGSFDEQYVLAQMAAGKDGAKAVKTYRRNIEKEIAKRNSDGAPRVLSGGGQVAQDTLNPSELGSKDVKSMVAGLIAQAQQEGN